MAFLAPIDLEREFEKPTVRKSIREKQLRAIKLGRRGGYRIRRSDLHEFLRKRETIKDDDLS